MFVLVAREPAAAQQAADTARVELGFAMGPLNRTLRYRTALEQVRRDGFRVIRAYEPFLRGDSGAIAPIVRHLQRLDSLGLTPYFSLSNFPHQLAGRDTAVTGATARRRASVFWYANRYPPPVAAFDSVMGGLITGLDQTFGRVKLREWYFEFGNEPDASLYFWGSPDDFTRLWTVAARRWLGYDTGLRVGAAGFTNALVQNGVGRSPLYTAFARTIAADPTVFVSFHVYAGLRTGRRDGEAINALLGPPARSLRVISEWNVSTQPGRATRAVLESPNAIGPYLIELLAAAAEAGVSLVLIHKLMDEPGTPQLGVFDAAGTPKAAYQVVTLARDFARRGYQTSREPAGAIRLTGPEFEWILAGTAPVPLRPGARIRTASFAGGSVVPAGGWALLERGTAGAS